MDLNAFMLSLLELSDDGALTCDIDNDAAKAILDYVEQNVR